MKPLSQLTTTCKRGWNLLLLPIFLLSAQSISAQTSDAQWCQLIEQSLSDQGINSEVRCDYVGNQKVLHVGVNGHVRNYDVLSVRQERRDYSSPVYVICDPLVYELPYMRRGYEPTRRGVTPGRTWRAYSSTLPDMVWEDPRDLDAIEVALQQAVGKPTRATLIDGRYAEQKAQDESAQVLELKTRIIECQRGERYEKPKADAPKGGHHDHVVERTYAYLEVNIQFVDYRTGEVLWQKSIDKDNYTFSVRYNDPMENCISYIANSVSSTLSSLYPTEAPRPNVQGQVIKMDEVKKEKVKSLFIDLGFDHELGNKENLYVYRVFSVAGQVGEEEVGRLQVEKIQGGSLTLCEVKKGEREVFNAFQSGETLVVRSRR